MKESTKYSKINYLESIRMFYLSICCLVATLWNPFKINKYNTFVVLQQTKKKNFLLPILKISSWRNLDILHILPACCPFVGFLYGLTYFLVPLSYSAWLINRFMFFHIFQRIHKVYSKINYLDSNRVFSEPYRLSIITIDKNWKDVISIYILYY